MRTIHVEHRFHSVGHGTFFTGIVTDDDATVFRWVYDCGSKRSTQIFRAINTLADLEHWPNNAEIDLLTISHFDDDHVNGLEQFLAQHRVKWLALPYMSLKSRLAHACSSTEEKSASASAATFAIDPIGFLTSRGLSDRVGSILLIQGGDGDGASDSGQQLLDPTNPEDFKNIQDQEISWTNSEYLLNGRVESSSGIPRVRVQPHSQPVAIAGLPMELVFFNAALPTGKTNRSKLPITDVQKEVAEILRRYRLLDPSKKPRRGWRDRLKGCFTGHFGSSGPERNNISLCVMARPLRNTPPSSCRLFDQHFQGNDIASCLSIDPDRQALLLTGDLSLDGSIIGEMQAHFRNWRWQQLAVTQVPHHGSRHSWVAGNAQLFLGSQFVHCVPTISRKNLHPHPSVVADLNGSISSHANYEQSVVHSYHFEV